MCAEKSSLHMNHGSDFDHLDSEKGEKKIKNLT